MFLKQIQKYTKNNFKLNYSKNLNVSYLEWKESFLKDGSAYYEHPTIEEILSVKQSRLIEFENNKKWNNFLKPEEIEKVKELRKENPWKYDSKELSKQFNVKPSLINMVSIEPEIKFKQDLKMLKEHNASRPKRGNDQSNNNVKIGRKIHSKKK
eukprot:gene5198-8804_t